MTKYYISEYGFDIQLAALLAAGFSIPGGVLRAIGGWFSDKYGAHTVTWWVLWVGLVCLFFLSYPQSDVIFHTINGPKTFHIGLDPTVFTVLMFTMGIAFAIGKASVFKYISDDYPHNIGVVSGVVGLAGGMGGFILPIMFGALVDLTGVRSSAFMLMFGIVWVSLMWMYFTEVRPMSAEQSQQAPGTCALLLKTGIRHEHARKGNRPAAPTSPIGVPRTKRSGKRSGKRIAYRNLWISMPALLCGFAVWGMWGIITVQMLNLGFPFTQAELFTLTAIAGISGATMRIPASFLIRLAGGRNTIFLTTAMLLAPALGTGIVLQHKDWPLWAFQLMALWCGVGGGNFASSMSNISTFFPKRLQGTALGLNAGLGNFGVTTMQVVIPLVMTVGIFGASAASR